MSDRQTELTAASTIEEPAFRKPSRLLIVGMCLAPFMFVWFLLRKGFSPMTRTLGFAWTILFTSSLQLLQNTPPAEPQRTQAIETSTIQSEPMQEEYEDGIRVTKHDFEARGWDWPLTVEEGHIGCDKGILLWVAIDGKKYGLNGTAIDWGYPSVRPFWRDNPAFPASGSGPKVSIQDLFDAAKATCSTSN